MKCLVVIAHPLENSLCQHIAQQTLAHLSGKGYQVTVKSLYDEQFDPVLSKHERASYYSEQFDSQKLKSDIAQLQQAQSLILIFPTWWFNFPAILKGWFDRVWAPGYAYHHATDFGPIQHGLTELKEMKVITTLGSPWWVDTFVMRKPVKKLLKLGLLGACTNKAKFQMLSFYNSEKATPAKVANFVKRIQKSI